MLITDYRLRTRRKHVYHRLPTKNQTKIIYRVYCWSLYLVQIYFKWFWSRCQSDHLFFMRTDDYRAWKYSWQGHSTLITSPGNSFFPPIKIVKKEFNPIENIYTFYSRNLLQNSVQYGLYRSFHPKSGVLTTELIDLVFKMQSIRISQSCATVELFYYVLKSFSSYQ